MKLEPELRAELMAEAKDAHRPASQVILELMREFVQRQREAREYEEFLHRKVEADRVSMSADLATRMKRLKGNSPHGVPVYRGSVESHLDISVTARPGRHMGLHRGRRPE
jgi:hypothetical protein